MTPPPMSLNKAELQHCLRQWHAAGANASICPPVLVSELILARDVLSETAYILADRGLAIRKVLPRLTAVDPGDVFLPFNYIEQGFSGILEQVPGTANTIDVHTTGADVRHGVILYLPDAPELQACIRLLPRYDIGAYLVFQRAPQQRNFLKIGTTGHLHAAYQNMVQAVIECWESL